MRISFPFKAFLVYLGCTAADFVSSMGHLPPGGYEANAFARHADGSFWPLHALGNCAMNTAETLLVCAGLYYLLAFAHRKTALFVSALPWFWYAYGHLDAAFQNLQTKLFYVPYEDPDKMFEIIRQLARLF
jgi:hypothetical protein